jgi:thiol-disulfide isomerase/thioredoxin
MKKTWCKIIIALLLAATNGAAQSATTGCTITVRFQNYALDTLWFGSYFGKRAEPDFAVAKNAEGVFVLSSEKKLPTGMYCILFKRGKANADFEHFAIWLADGQRRFFVEVNYPHPLENARIEGSPENARLLAYVHRYEKWMDSLYDRTNDWKSLRTENAFRRWAQVQENLRNFQETTLAECATDAPLTAELLRQTLFLTPTKKAGEDKRGWQAEAAERQNWLRQHFFDRMDLGSGQFLKQPLWVDRTDYFFSKLPPPEPDSMISMVEEVLHRLEPDQIASQYYFRYMMNSMSKMSRYRTDEVFVFFVRNWVEKGKADFLSTDRREKYLDDAERMEPLFVGKKVPDAAFLDKNGSSVTVHTMEAPYLLLVFWLHDCGHCKKEIPVVKQVFDHWRAKNLQVFSVCGSGGEDKTAACYEFAERMAMPAEWTVVNDPLRRSRFGRLYHVSSYPRMILLDAEKRVLFKHTGEATAEMLEAEFARAIR